MISAAIVAKKLAIVITITSRLITWVISCASTPSSSAGESRPSRPRVAQTVADFCERPSAQAFGISASITATRGFGRSAWMHSRSMIACSSGSSAGETSCAPSVASAILSEPTTWKKNRPTAMATISTRAGAARKMQRADEHGVEQPEQEQRQAHAGLEPGVAAECAALAKPCEDCRRRRGRARAPAGALDGHRGGPR